ncbi:hypothetical protein KCU83_g299, partial [Aureobasidium melanogenum]
MPGSIATNATKDFSVSTIFVVTCSSTKPRGRRSNALMPGATRVLTERLTLAAMSAVYTYTCENTNTLVRHIEGSCSKRTGVDRKRLKNSLAPAFVNYRVSSFGSRLAYELHPLSAVVCTGDENPDRCRS